MKLGLHRELAMRRLLLPILLFAAVANAQYVNQGVGATQVGGRDSQGQPHTANTDSTGNLTVVGSPGGQPIAITGNITASNPSVGATGVAPPGSATLIGGSSTNGTMRAVALDDAGAVFINGGGGGGGGTVTQGPAGTSPWFIYFDGGLVTAVGLGQAQNPAGGVLSVQVPNNGAAGALGALNAAVTQTVGGENGCGFQLSAGTLIGTIVPEVTVDNSATWTQSFFTNPLTGQTSPSLVFGSANTVSLQSIIPVSGMTACRARVSAYTSGTANGAVTVSTLASPTTPAMGHDGQSAMPLDAVQIGGYDGVTYHSATFSTQGQPAANGGTGAMFVQASNTPQAGGTMNALNAVCGPINAAGSSGVSFVLQAGTLVGTITPECNSDGINWTACYFADPATLNVTPNIVFGSANPVTVRGLVAMNGNNQFRVRVSAFTSGTASCTMIGTSYYGYANAAAGANAGTVQPSTVEQVGGWDGTNLRAMAMDSSGHPIVVGPGVAGTPSGGVQTIQGVGGGTAVTVSGTVAATESGTWTVQPGNTANTTPWLETIQNGGNAAAVKAASTAAVATDPALVVAISPNNSISASFTAVDTTGTGTLNALNATATITVTGSYGVGMQLLAGTLVGTIVPEISMDSGTTWVGTYFDDPVTGVKVASIVFGANNTAQTKTIIGAGGMNQARIRVSAFTSGTATCNLRGTSINDPSVLFAGATGSAVPPTVAQVGGSDGANLRVLSTDATGDLKLFGTVDVTGTGTLNAANTTAVVVVSGASGAGMQLLAGTLVGTIVPEISMDSGTTWVASFFRDPVTRQDTSSIVFGSANTATTRAIVLPGGTNQARVRVSAFTSGTATCNVRATSAFDPQVPTGVAGTSAVGVVTVQGIAAGTAVPASESGTWTVQPGNTANTTPWLIQGQTANNVAIASNPVRIGATSTANQAALTTVTTPRATDLKADLEGRFLVRDDHPNNFFCNVTVAASTATQCQALTAGSKLYMTDFILNSTSAAGLLQIEYGTGVNCAAGPTPMTPVFTITPSGVSINSNLRTPIPTAVANEICCVGGAASTGTCLISGYIAP